MLPLVQVSKAHIMSSTQFSYDHPLPDDLTAMADMFEGIQSLPHPLPGVPNFRRVPSYKVTCN